MKLIVSFSCGKDSTLALHRVKEAGHDIIGLLVTVNEEEKRSWFHGVNRNLLSEISKSLEIPLFECLCKGEEYHLEFENTLRKAQSLGAEGAVFGDIDIADHLKWCTDRCDAVGMKAVFPLWQENRDALVHEFVSLGYRALLKCINNELLSEDVLGAPLSKELLDYFKTQGIDTCGENGEYHTVVVDGPDFKYPISVSVGEPLSFGKLSVVDIILEK